MIAVLVVLSFVSLALTVLVGAGAYYVGRLRTHLEAYRTAAEERQVALVGLVRDVANYVVAADNAVGRRLTGLELLPAEIQAAYRQIRELRLSVAKAPPPKEDKPHVLAMGEMPKFDTANINLGGDAPEKKAGQQQ